MSKQPAGLQVGFRLPPDDVEAIDALATRMTKDRFGLAVSRTEALITLIRAGAKALGVPHTALAPAAPPEPPEPPEPEPQPAAQSPKAKRSKR